MTTEEYEAELWDAFTEANELRLENDELKAENAKLRERIVRCKDCAHSYEGRRDTAVGWVDMLVCDCEQWSTVSLMPSHEVEPDGYCAWGERREGKL